MKKILLSISALTFTAQAFSQIIDTLTSHMANSTSYVVFQYDAGDYISGNNELNELAAVQLFDSKYGVLGKGEINGVLVHIGHINDAGGTFSVKLYGDDNGKPSQVLGSKTLNISDIETEDVVFAQKQLYNVNVKFDSPISIPSNKKFWAGVEYPKTQVQGDTLAVSTSDDNEFNNVETHSGVLTSNELFESFDLVNLDIALAIFPYVSFDEVVGIEQSANVPSVKIFPNPANKNLNINLGSSSADEVIVSDISGKIVESLKGDVSNLITTEYPEGIYFLQFVRKNVLLETRKFNVQH